MLAAQDLTIAGRLNGVSARLRQGEVTVICGPNGAGKSSLLSCLAGLLAPAMGSVTLDQASHTALPLRTRAQAIGYLPQQAELAWDVSVETLVGLGRLPWGDRNPAAIDAALVVMDLADLRHRPVSRLSGGERARAMMARVLAGEPRWILADEPLAALDLAHQLNLLARLRAAAGQGAGVVLVLHDLALAMNYADRVLVLNQGRLVQDGPPQQALAEAVIADVWGTKVQWLGDSGARALAILPD